MGETVVFDNVVFTAKDVSETAGSAMFIKDGANVTITNSIFKDNDSTSGKKVAGAIWLYANYDSLLQDATQAEKYAPATLTLNNVVFEGNKSEWGGALYVYPKSQTTMTGGAFIGNQAVASGDAYGGAIMFKGGKATFKDALFQDNVAQSENSVAVGGAIITDITSNKDVNKVPFEELTEVTIQTTKDMTYSGNNVISENSDPTDTYGYWAYTSGGFLFLDRRSKVIFDMADGTTLTLGKSDATGHMDSIASAIPKVSDSPKSTMIKQGKGTLLINSSMNYFFSDLFVNEGTMQLTKDQTSKATIVVDGGSLIYDKKLTLQDMVVNEGKTSEYFLVGSLNVKSGQAKINELTLETSTESPNKAQVQVSGGELVVDSLVLKTGDVAISALHTLA